MSPLNVRLIAEYTAAVIRCRETYRREAVSRNRPPKAGTS